MGAIAKNRGYPYMTSGDDFILTTPDKTVQWQQAGGDVQHSTGRLLRGARVDNCHTTIVSGESKSVSTGRKGDSLDPASGIIQELSTDCVEGETLTPGAWLGTVIDTLDEAGEYSGVGVGRARSKQDRVRVPCQCSNGTPDGLLQVLRDPPVVLLFEVANGDHTSPGTDGEFLLRGGPSDKGCGTVDAEKDQCRLPARGSLLPNISITVCDTNQISLIRAESELGENKRLTLRASHNATAVGCNVHAGDSLLVALELIAQRELVA